MNKNYNEEDEKERKMVNPRRKRKVVLKKNQIKWIKITFYKYQKSEKGWESLLYQLFLKKNHPLYKFSHEI